MPIQVNRVANPPGLSGILPDFRQNLNLPAGDENLPDSSKSPGKIVNRNICLVHCGRKTEVRTLCGKSQKSDFRRRFSFRFTEFGRFAGVIFL